MKHQKLTCILLIYSIWLSLSAPLIPAQNNSFEPEPKADQPEKKGLQFRLREPANAEENRKSSELPATTALSESETNAILRRLPPIASDPVDESDFAARLNSLPPPKTGNIIPTKFPADDQPAAPAVNNSAILEIVRFAPEGNIQFAPTLSVTFSQPMVVIGTQESASENSPVKISPQLKGKWRWVGTNTLVFDAESRFPMATKFTATIPANTKSAIGGRLEKEASWTFSTAPPAVTNFDSRTLTLQRDALLLTEFNQKINPEAVLPQISAVSNNQKIPLRLASESEITASEAISGKIKNILPKRFIVFCAAELLPVDSEINVTFEAGMPSAEGALVSTTPQSYSFKTFGTLKFEKSYCGYDENGKLCEPQNSFNIKFNNPLDKMSFDKSLVKIEPAIENAEISVSGDEIEIQGSVKPRSPYKVTVSGALKDDFGQSLGSNVSTIFKIEAQGSRLYSQGDNFVVLDPNAKPKFSVYSINHKSLKVRLYKVRPEDYTAFQEFLADEDASGLPQFGKLVFNKLVPVDAEPDEQIETRIDIDLALKDNLGHAVLIVDPPSIKGTENEFDYENRRIITWIEATQIGLDAFTDYEKLTAYASDLKTGQPLNNIELKLLNGASSVTNESGLAELKLPSKNQAKSTALIARRGKDTAILFERRYYNDETGWVSHPPSDSLRWFVFNDRNMYRAGETVSIKGYIRRITGGKFSEVSESAGSAKELNYILKDSQNNEVLKGKAFLNPFGAFDFTIKLPENIDLGYQELELTADTDLEKREFLHRFQVQEFRRPEFEVTANVQTAAPFYVGDSATVGVEAKYYSGGNLPNAETKWHVSSSPANYTPPNRNDFTFGRFVPWWHDYDSGDYDQRDSQEFKGVTAANGKHRLNIDFVSANPSRPYTINAEASVQDVNRQTFSASTSLLVHPSELYVGLRTPKTFVSANEQFKVETITTDINGAAVANALVSIVAELEGWEQIKGEWQKIIIDTQKCEIRSQTDVASCVFTAKQGGTYEITASVFDSRERRNESELTVWVAGGKIEPTREVEEENAELIPDKKEYAPNDTAEILVNAPFYPAEGILTLRRNGIVKIERFTMKEPSTVLQIPIEERYLPNIHVRVDLVGETPRIIYEDARDEKLPKRPAFAGGELNLSVSTASRKLSVTAEPLNNTLEPGGATVVNVDVKDSVGNPAADSEVALVAVDESVLALTKYKIPDPLAEFYQEIEAETTDHHSREKILLSYPDDIGFGRGNGYGDGDGNGSGGGGGGGAMYANIPMRPATQGTRVEKPSSFAIDEEPPIPIRKNFNALAIFAPTVRTDANGKAVISIKLPDNLTRYRITAVAVTASKQFGITESNITAKQPLMVRPSAPRFMNFGDRIDLPVVLQNQTNNSLTVNVAVRATNAVLMDGNGKKITIAANDRAEVRFDVTTDKAGTARFQIGATSGKLADAAEIELPVYTPATSEAFAAYGTTDQNGAIIQPIAVPKDVVPQVGGLEITTSSTQLQELTDAFIYLQNYPYECSEQISSRILSAAALRDVLTAFKAKDTPTKAEIEVKMKSDIERLRKLQHPDGGFSFWKSDDESIPFVSVHVAHALARAVLNGYPVPPAVTAGARGYLKNIDSKSPAFYGSESRRALSAYALYVLDLFGEKDAPKARKLLRDEGAEKFSPESLGWLLSVLANDNNSKTEVDSIKRYLMNRVTETAGAANFITDYKEGVYVLLASNRRADGIILEALLKAEPGHDLIPKLVRGLLANKTRGRWANTQENAFILLALDKYFKTYERITPNFSAKVWYGQIFAGEQYFKGRSTDSNSIKVPMSYLQKQTGNNDPVNNLVLDKQGDGRLYYRIGLSYALKDLNIKAADYGFTVTRKYEAVDNPEDVRLNPDGSWTIKSGSRVRVNLQMVAPTRRYHVALVDKLPAGFEIINPELAISGTLPKETKSSAERNDHQYPSIWFEHQNLRDERAEAFTSLLTEGVWEYSYVVRATTPGKFIAPPAKAEEMYSPEVFGRTSSNIIKVD